jgi:hypothetical protein
VKKMLRIRNKRAQSTAEYAIVIGLVIAAIGIMEVYVKRGMQARLKMGTDFLSKQSTTANEYALTRIKRSDTTTNTTKQYEPYYTTSDITTGQIGSERVQVIGDVFQKSIVNDAAGTGQVTTRESGGVQTYEAPD